MSQNRKDLQTQVARIKQAIEKVLDKYASLEKRIHILFREQGITFASKLTAFSMTIATIVLAVTDVFEGGSGGARGTLSKDKGTLKNGYIGWRKHLKGWREKLPRHCLLS